MAGRSAVDQFHFVRELVTGLQELDEGWPEGIIPHQDVSEAENGYAAWYGLRRIAQRHDTLTRDSSFPDTSSV